MAPTNPFQCLTLTLLVLPPLLLTVYFFSQFPYAPELAVIHSGLSSLPPDNMAWSIYPEDFFPGGAYVNLPYGTVRYWLLGSERGKKIALIHGLSIPAMIWKDVAPALAAHGYRVLVYDLYGRGFSDAPQVTYDSPLYATQLALLMQHIRWEKAFVAGVSMGGGVAAAFSAHFPQLVNCKIALIASAGLMDPSDMSRTTRFMSSPLVQSVTSSAPFRFYLQRLANASHADPINETPDPCTIDQIVRIQSAHLPGYNAAIASSLRDGPIRGLAPAFKTLGASSNEVLLIWGTADNTVPYRYASIMQQLLPHSQLITVDGGGHDLTVSHPDLIVKAFLRFFQ